jgi:hypothetical protein
MSIFSSGNTTASIRTRHFKSINLFRSLLIIRQNQFISKPNCKGTTLQQQTTANEIKAQVQYWFYQLQYLQNSKKATAIIRQFV